MPCSKPGALTPLTRKLANRWELGHRAMRFCVPPAEMVSSFPSRLGCQFQPYPNGSRKVRALASVGALFGVKVSLVTSGEGPTHEPFFVGFLVIATIVFWLIYLYDPSLLHHLGRLVFF